MKTLLPSLLLLAASAAYAADAGETTVMADGTEVTNPVPGSSVFVNDPNGFGVGTGSLMPDGSVMGPLCPPSICPTTEAETQAAAFNAASQLPPPGQKWASPGCTRIPCRLEEDPNDPRVQQDPEQAGEEIVVTAPRRDKGNPDKSNNGAVVTATPGGTKVVTPDGTPAGRTLTPEQVAQLRAEEEARNKGFTPDGGFRGDGTTRGGNAVVAPDRAGDSSIPGMVGDMLGQFIASDFGSTGPGTGPSSQQANVVKGDLGDVVQVQATWETVQQSRGGLISLERDAGRQISLLEKVAGSGPNAISAGNTSADDGTQGCQRGQGGDMTPCLGVSNQ